MLVCPSCHAEYRDGFTACASCHIPLVDQARLEDEARLHGTPKERLKDKRKVLIPQASLMASRELEGALLKADIDCYTHVEEADADVALGSASAMQYAVVLDEDDVDRAKAAMKERFKTMLEKEGFSQLQTEAIDLEAAEVLCPACQHLGALAAGECAECGLFLGAPE